MLTYSSCLSQYSIHPYSILSPEAPVPIPTWAHLTKSILFSLIRKTHVLLDLSFLSNFSVPVVYRVIVLYLTANIYLHMGAYHVCFSGWGNLAQNDFFSSSIHLPTSFMMPFLLFFLDILFKMLFHFPPLPTLILLLWRYSHFYLPTPNSVPWYYPRLGKWAFTGPTNSSIEARQCHPLLHMRLESCVSPSMLFGWWFSPWELWRVCLVDTVVLPMGLQTHSAPSVLSLTPPLGCQCSVWCLSASILICISRALAEPLRRHPYQAPVSKHFLASAIVNGFGDCIWDGQSLDDLFFSPWSTLFSLHFLSWVFCSPF